MSIIFSHPTGNANVRAIVKRLLEERLLFQFYTSIALFPGTFLYALSTLKQFLELKRREFHPSLKSITHTSPWLEVARMVTLKMNLTRLIEHERGIFSIDALYRNHDKKVASKLKYMKNNVNGVYAYEDAAFYSFTEAKKNGIKCFYDLPIAYWETGRKLMQEEAERLPQWAATLGGGIKDSESKLARKTRELELADMVICPSTFVTNSLPVWARNKRIVFSPFGSPLTTSKVDEPFKIKNNYKEPLRVLFVGSMGQRKGLADLFEAFNILNSSQVELIIMGSLLAPISFYKTELQNFIYERGRSHEQVLELMRSCDVFCLPSVVEGRALVIQEAMSQGLPVIITENTGAGDLIEEGKTGFLVPMRQPEKIAEKLNWFIENRSKIGEMGILAKQKASTYTWENYASTIIEEIKKLS